MSDVSAALGDLIPQDGEQQEPEFYPGSRRKRPERTAKVEFVSDPWRENFVLKNVGGEEVKMYTVGSLADALGVSVPTIRLWTTNGVLPEAPYRLPSNMVVHGQKVEGRRLYTEAVIDATVRVFEQHGLLGSLRIRWRDHPQVPIDLIREWKKVAVSKSTTE